MGSVKHSILPPILFFALVCFTWIIYLNIQILELNKRTEILGKAALHLKDAVMRNYYVPPSYEEELIVPERGLIL